MLWIGSALLLFLVRRPLLGAGYLWGAVLIAWAVVGLLWSASPYDTAGESCDRLAMAGISLAASQCRDPETVLAGLVCGLCISAPFALMQIQGATPVLATDLAGRSVPVPQCHGRSRGVRIGVGRSSQGVASRARPAATRCSLGKPGGAAGVRCGCRRGARRALLALVADRPDAGVRCAGHNRAPRSVDDVGAGARGSVADCRDEQSHFLAGDSDAFSTLLPGFGYVHNDLSPARLRARHRRSAASHMCFFGRSEPGYPNPRPSRLSSERRWCRSRLITRRERCWWLCSRVCALALAIVVSAANTYSEWRVLSDLSMSSRATPQETYDALARDGRLWPLDRSIRWAAEQWRLTFEKIVREHAHDRSTLKSAVVGASISLSRLRFCSLIAWPAHAQVGDDLGDAARSVSALTNTPVAIKTTQGIDRSSVLRSTRMPRSCTCSSSTRTPWYSPGTTAPKFWIPLPASVAIPRQHRREHARGDADHCRHHADGRFRAGQRDAVRGHLPMRTRVTDRSIWRPASATRRRRSAGDRHARRRAIC